MVRSKKQALLICLCLGIVILMSAIVGGLFALDHYNEKRAQDVELALIERKYLYTDAARACEVNIEAITILDGGETLSIEGVGLASDYRPTVSGEGVVCMLSELGAPASASVKMGNTRSLDGTQSTSWGDYSASWTFHPDDGLNLLIERTSERPHL